MHILIMHKMYILRPNRSDRNQLRKIQLQGILEF